MFCTCLERLEADILRIRTQAAGDSQVDGDQQQAWFRDMWEGKAQEEPSHTKPADNEDPAAENTNDDDDDDFGDDFDEFAEEGGDDDDFGDFDEADADEPPAVADNAQQSAQQTIHTSLAGLVSSSHTNPTAFSTSSLQIRTVS